MDNKTHDPNAVAADLIASANRMDGMPHAAPVQAQLLVAAAGFSIAAAIDRLASVAGWLQAEAGRSGRVKGE